MTSLQIMMLPYRVPVPENGGTSGAPDARMWRTAFSLEPHGPSSTTGTHNAGTPQQGSEPQGGNGSDQAAAASGGCCTVCGAVSSEKLSKCGGCRVVRYCSRKCQKRHWPVHKMKCDRIRQEREAQQEAGM